MTAEGLGKLSLPDFYCQDGLVEISDNRQDRRETEVEIRTGRCGRESTCLLGS